MKTIQLTKGQVAIVDDQDYQRLSHFKWCAQASYGQFYAVHFDHVTRTQIRMHRLVLYAPRDVEADHVNGDTLDNRRANLRLAAHAENMRNRRIPSTNTSGFKGVGFHKLRRRWQAYIKVRGKQYHLGCFATPEAAAAEYDRAARLSFGRFARTNDKR
jgi:HNH endonuclease/AP2 domain